MLDIVEQYLEKLQAKEWTGLGATLAATGFERVGPFCDVIDGKDDYVRFLDGIVSTLDDYRVRARRISVSEGVVYAEVNESFVTDGTAMDFPEVLVFDIGDDGLITRVQVYMMHPGEEAPVPGGKAEAPRGEKA